ncbi:DUF4159 domain-containing protein [Candidatus Latescibacterota bacterium]
MKKALLWKLKASLPIVLSLIIHIVPVTAQREAKPPKAVVVTDPKDKQSINGYVYIATVWGQQLKLPRQYPRALIHLKDAMNRWTEVYTNLDNPLKLDSKRLLEMPFVFITTDGSFILTPIERENVREYFEKGGFMVFDNARPSNTASPAGKSFKQMIRDVLGEQAVFRTISDNHHLFHCFFDFPEGAPEGIFLQKQIPGHLDGIMYNNRLAAVYSNMGYVGKWNDDTGNTLQLKMGVNMVIYALTQQEHPSQQK